MSAALRHRIVNLFPQPSARILDHLSRSFSSLTPDADGITEILKLEEIESILEKVHADDVKVIPVKNICSWADYMVFASGRSTWHVKNIAQAILFEVKEKQRGAKRMVLPTVEGQKEGHWIVIDSGPIMIHAFEEKARAYYDLERHWTSPKAPLDSAEDISNAIKKVRSINNSKKKVKRKV